jgi:hypothetical protein
VLDMKVGRLDEGLEPEQTQLVEFHIPITTKAGALHDQHATAPAHTARPHLANRGQPLNSAGE